MTDLRSGPFLAPLVLVASALLAAPSLAAPVVTFTQATADPASPCSNSGLCIVPLTVSQARGNWLANITGAAFEEFETEGSRTADTPALFGGTATLSSTGLDNSFNNQPLTNDIFLGRFNTTNGGGSTGWWFESGPGSTTLRFSAPVEAFALYLTDLGDEGQGTAAITLAIGEQILAGGQGIAIARRDTSGQPLPLSTDNQSVAFFGVISDGNPFDKVTLHFASGAQDLEDYVGLDSLVIGNVDANRVPVPGTLPLVGLALLGLVGVRRRGCTLERGLNDSTQARENVTGTNLHRTLTLGAAQG